MSEFSLALKRLYDSIDHVTDLVHGSKAARDKTEKLMLMGFEIGLMGGSILHMLQSPPTDADSMTCEEFVFVTIGYGMGQTQLMTHGDIEETNKQTH